MVFDQVMSWGTALKPVHQLAQPGNPATVLGCALIPGILELGLCGRLCAKMASPRVIPLGYYRRRNRS
jgi:hypothetical protein